MELREIITQAKHGVFAYVHDSVSVLLRAAVRCGGEALWLTGRLL